MSGSFAGCEEEIVVKDRSEAYLAQCLSGDLMKPKLLLYSLHKVKQPMENTVDRNI